MSAGPVYPVRLEGHLEGNLSRWLWLVKWFLLIPHIFVLVFLWIGGLFAWIGAFFAILFTKRYPRGIFNYLLGVMRWTWRVSFYSYSALGTDRYPPFSMGEEPDYPARLYIDYPEKELSRGLVLVKWWLLAIPHYLIVGIMTGGSGSSGLVTILVLIAGVALLFTKKYPRGLFDIAMGFNRWSTRVTTYAVLMTDQYPPFRLDMGAEEPASVPSPDPSPPATAGPAAA